MQTLILAKSITEANAYAKSAGLQRFTFRSVRSAGSIRGVRGAEVHVLPSFLKRPDRHAILAALRSARSLEIFYVDPADFEGEPTEDSNALETGTGPTDREIEVAYRYHALREAAQVETPGAGDKMPQVETPGAGSDAEKVVAKPRKPRTPKPTPPAADFFA